MGLVFATEGGLHQTETYIPSRQCVEANGAGGRASNYEKWTNKSVVGKGSSNLPNLQAIWFLKTCRYWWYHTSFYVETKRQVKLIHRKKLTAAFQMSQQKFQYLRREMTVWVTDVLRRITPKLSSIFLISLASNKWYCSVCTWGARGMPKFSSKNSQV